MTSVSSMQSDWN